MSATPRVPPEERRVPTLPVVAVVTLLCTASAVLLANRFARRAPTAASPLDRANRANEPVAARDQEHYVPGSPPAVAEAFLRAWMRARYADARDLSAGPLRQSAEQQAQELRSLTGDAAERIRQTTVYLDATRFDLEHVALRDLPPSPEGHPRKEVRGQAHAYGSYNGTRMDSRRGQTFVLELVDGAWRVTERDWERTGTGIQHTADPSSLPRPGMPTL